MILAVDVDYRDGRAGIAGVGFSSWTDPIPSAEYRSVLEPVEDYQPGQFYRRELPCIRQLLDDHDLKPKIIVIDGFVWLDGDTKPGLGWHLHEALNSHVPVIGVAKNPFDGIDSGCALLRGNSSKPLWVTAIGMSLDQARSAIACMHGEFRMPTLLKRADSLSRAWAAN